eukprot:scaffold315522_cov61-Attheya_sp.AAC.1
MPLERHAMLGTFEYICIRLLPRSPCLSVHADRGWESCCSISSECFSFRSVLCDWLPLKSSSPIYPLLLIIGADDWTPLNFRVEQGTHDESTKAVCRLSSKALLGKQFISRCANGSTGDHDTCVSPEGSCRCADHPSLLESKPSDAWNMICRSN